MNNEFFKVKDQLALEQIKKYITGMTATCEVIEPSELSEQPFLLATLPEGTGSFNVMYIPLPEDHFEAVRLLQVYASVVSDVNKDNLAALYQVLNGINEMCPIGTFTLNAKDEIGFRYVFPVDRFDLPDEGKFLDVFTMYLNFLETFRTTLVGVNFGVLTPAAALHQLMPD